MEEYSPGSKLGGWIATPVRQQGCVISIRQDPMPSNFTKSGISLDSQSRSIDPSSSGVAVVVVVVDVVVVVFGADDVVVVVVVLVSVFEDSSGGHVLMRLQTGLSAKYLRQHESEVSKSCWAASCGLFQASGYARLFEHVSFLPVVATCHLRPQSA